MTTAALELFKLRSQRSMWVILGLALGLPLLGLVAVAVAPEPGMSLATEAGQRAFFRSASGITPALIFGVLVITGDYRHRTITATLLATPRREKMMLGKLVAVTGVALLYGLVLAALSIAALLIALNAEGVTLELTVAEAVVQQLRDIVAVALFAAFGLGVGAIIANQVGALLVVLVAEPFLGQFLSLVAEDVVRFFPSQVGIAFLDRFSRDDLLSPAFAGVVLLIYAAVAIWLGIVATNRRDIA